MVTDFGGRRGVTTPLPEQASTAVWLVKYPHLNEGINKGLKMKPVRSLVWTVPTYGAQGWTLTNGDEKRIESAELWIYCRMLRVRWTEHRTDESILTEFNTARQLLGFVVRRKHSPSLDTPSERAGASW